ncbi:hypothetical protein BGP_3228 [Beggiatoa sp. PS]|nr:hypothetical protein BGP_3228 [Beggiatoa sp. PS]
MGVKLDKQPASNKSVTISFYDNRRKVPAKEGREAYYQFRGYQYAKKLASSTAQKK